MKTKITSILLSGRPLGHFKVLNTNYTYVKLQ